MTGMKARYLLLGLGAALLAVWTVGCGSDGPPTGPAGGPDPVDEVEIPAEPFVGTASTITELEIQQLVTDIAHDSPLGRGSPSPELNEVALYIADVFAAAGLTPAGDDGYLQWFPVEGPGAPPAPNVIGWIQGSDPVLRDEFVVLSAHFDHLGGVDIGPGMDQVYNGADDNASGTSALLEIAGAVGAMSTPPKRSIVFLAASAEELGLRGSLYYMSHSPFPPEATVANLNFDMIGRGETNHVWLIHETSSEIAPIALAVAAQHPSLGLAPEDRPDDSLVRRSDSGAFVLYGVDALFFFSGFHADYHQVSDEAGLLNALKIEKVAKLGYWVAVELAGRP
jgi:hypothetical protein